VLRLYIDEDVMSNASTQNGSRPVAVIGALSSFAKAALVSAS
jgi:hypothetical protein